MAHHWRHISNSNKSRRLDRYSQRKVKPNPLFKTGKPNGLPVFVRCNPRSNSCLLLVHSHNFFIGQSHPDYKPHLSLGKVGGAPAKINEEVKKMKKKILILIGGLLAVAMIFGAAKVTTAYAQSGTPPTPSADAGQLGDGPGHGGGRGMGETELAAAAKVLGMTSDELSTALKSGKTLADLATTAGVDIKDVQAAISAAHAVEMRAQIEAGVADGTITQEKATWLLEGLDKGFLDGPGFGFGGPHGGPDGKLGDQPPAQSTQSAK
jgi:hypothetical protein